MKKRGFTTIELLSVIIILAIIMGIAVIGLNYVLDKGNESFYQNVEQELMLSGTDYFNNHRDLKPIDGKQEVEISTLIKDGYIEPITDKDGNICNDGKVYIFAEGDKFNYEACLDNCGGYTSNSELCLYENDSVPPTCTISLSRNWLVIGDGTISYNIRCEDDKHFYDSSVGTSNIKLSNKDTVILGVPRKSSENDDGTIFNYSGTITGKNAGSTTFTLLEGTVSDGGFNKNVEVVAPQTLTVYKKSTEGTPAEGLIFNGNNQVLISGGINVTYNITTGKDAGTYTIIIKANDDSLFADGKKEHEVTVTISKKILTVPSQSGSLTYNGESQSSSWNNYDSSLMTIEGTTSATNAGKYKAKFVLNDKNNYTWNDDSNIDKEVEWIIGKKSCTCSITNIPEIKYPGNSVDVTYSCGGDGIKSISSNNTSIVKVVNGKLEPQNFGNNVTITASQAEGTNYSACSNGTKVINVSSSSYSISYELNGGTKPSSGIPESYTYGNGATINGTPSKSGYTFNGWCTASNLTSCAFSQSINGTTSGAKTYYAKWCQNCASVSNGKCTLTASTAGTCSYATSCNTGYTLTSGSGTYNPTCSVNSYTLTYNANGGSIGTTSKTINYGAGYGTLPTATKTGYNLDGWYTAASGGTKVTASTTIGAGNTTIYAHWAAKTYTITLNQNGATTNGTGSVTSTYNSSTISSITKPQKSYKITFSAGSTGATLSSTSSTGTYSFDGWYTATSGGSKIIDASGALVANVSGYTDANKKWIRDGGVTLYARWSGGTISIPSITKGGYSCGFGSVTNPPTSVQTYTVSCSQCAAGKYSNGGACQSCGSGTYSNAGASSCTTCPAGSYCTNGIKTACPAGKYSSDGASSCTVCGEGKYPNASASSCITCPSGYYCTGGIITICPAGKTSTLGSVSCSTCSAGTFSEAGGVCESCPVGTYSSAGASSCTSCPSGQTTSSSGSTSSSACYTPCTRTSSCGCESYGAWSSPSSLSWYGTDQSKNSTATKKWTCNYTTTSPKGSAAPYACTYQTRYCNQYKCC